jgi:CRP-like cAMP-binding protein
VFQRDGLSELYQRQPGLSFDVTWLAAREERMLDEHLLSVGRRTATERAAYLVAFLHQRAAAVGLSGDKPLLVPITQQHVADTLGLSIVHTNKTLRKLAERGLLRWHDRACEVLDVRGLMEIAEWEGLPEHKRPLI